MSKLGIAGRQLIKGNIGNAIIALTTKSYNSPLQSLPIQASRWRNGSFFFGINGADKAFVWGGLNSSLIAYQKNPIVSAVINKKAQALVNGKQMIMTGTGKSSKEAMTPEAKALRVLLKKPNPYQSGREFRAQHSVYKQIYGYCPVLKFAPTGYEGDFTKWKLWNLPPWMIQTQDTNDLWYLSDSTPFQSIRLTYGGHSVELPQDKIFFVKENQISTSTYNAVGDQQNASLFLPDSKLYALENNISNFIASLNSRGSLIRDRGPQWLLTNDSGDGDSGLFPVTDDDKDAIYGGFSQYGIMNGQRKAIITDAKLKLQTVGFDVGQLRLLEGEIQDAKQICDGLNYPPYLLGLVDAKFDNQDIAERAFYTNSIIPDCDSDDEQWAEMLGLDALGLRLETDFSHLPALQENITEQGKGRWYMDQALLIEWQNDLLTWNEWRVQLGLDAAPGRDLYYSEMVAQGIIKPVTAAPTTANVSSDTASSNNSNSNNGSAN